MNIYKYRFTSPCPNNEVKINYKLTIKTNSIIMCEEIVKVCDDATGYQESIADDLYHSLGGCVVIVGTHSGVKVKTIRCE